MPFRGTYCCGFCSFEKAAPKKEAGGDEKHSSFLLGQNLLKSVNFISCIGIIFFHLGVVPDTRVWGSQSKNKPSEIASDDRKRIKFAYFAVLAVLKHWCPKHTKHDTTKDV